MGLSHVNVFIINSRSMSRLGLGLLSNDPTSLTHPGAGIQTRLGVLRLDGKFKG